MACFKALFVFSTEGLRAICRTSVGIVDSVDKIPSRKIETKTLITGMWDLRFSQR